jgi:hypothetical protein
MATVIKVVEMNTWRREPGNGPRWPAVYPGYHPSADDQPVPSSRLARARGGGALLFCRCYYLQRHPLSGQQPSRATRALPPFDEPAALKPS